MFLAAAPLRSKAPAPVAEHNACMEGEEEIKPLKAAAEKCRTLEWPHYRSNHLLHI